MEKYLAEFNRHVSAAGLRYSYLVPIIFQLPISIVDMCLGIFAMLITPQYSLASFWAGIISGICASWRLAVLFYALNRKIAEKKQKKVTQITTALSIISFIICITGGLIDTIGAYHLFQINFNQCAYTNSSEIISPCPMKTGCTQPTYPPRTCYCCDVFESQTKCSVSLFLGQRHYYSGVGSCNAVSVLLKLSLVFLTCFHIVLAILSLFGIWITKPLKSASNYVEGKYNNQEYPTISTELTYDTTLQQANNNRVIPSALQNALSVGLNPSLLLQMQVAAALLNTANTSALTPNDASNAGRTEPAPNSIDKGQSSSRKESTGKQRSSNDVKESSGQISRKSSDRKKSSSRKESTEKRKSSHDVKKSSEQAPIKSSDEGQSSSRKESTEKQRSSNDVKESSGQTSRKSSDREKSSSRKESTEKRKSSHDVKESSEQAPIKSSDEGQSSSRKESTGKQRSSNDVKESSGQTSRKSSDREKSSSRKESTEKRKSSHDVKESSEQASRKSSDEGQSSSRKESTGKQRSSNDVKESSGQASRKSSDRKKSSSRKESTEKRKSSHDVKESSEQAPIKSSDEGESSSRKESKAIQASQKPKTVKKKH